MTAPISHTSDPSSLFFAVFVKACPDIAKYGNMRQVSEAGRQLARLNKDCKPFWDLIESNAPTFVGGATSSEAAKLASAMAALGNDSPSFFKELVKYFDPEKDNDLADYFDHDYLRPASLPASTPTLPPFYAGTYDKLTRRLHYTTPSDFADFCSAFSDLNYDSPALFGKAVEYQEFWCEDDDARGRIGESMRKLGYDVEGSRYA